MFLILLDLLDLLFDGLVNHVIKVLELVADRVSLSTRTLDVFTLPGLGVETLLAFFALVFFFIRGYVFFLFLVFLKSFFFNILIKLHSYLWFYKRWPQTICYLHGPTMMIKIKIVKLLKGDDFIVCFCLTCYALLSLNSRNNLLIFFQRTNFYLAFINLIHKCIGPHHFQRGVD